MAIEGEKKNCYKVKPLKISFDRRITFACCKGLAHK